MRKRRLPMRDCIKRAVRIGHDLLAVAARDRVMLGESFAGMTATLHARSSRTDLVLRFERDALRLKRSVVDARIDIELGQTRLDMLGPTPAPAFDLACLVPPLGTTSCRERGGQTV